jgi:hypothetical protein
MCCSFRARRALMVLMFCPVPCLACNEKQSGENMYSQRDYF